MTGDLRAGCVEVASPAFFHQAPYTAMSHAFLAGKPGTRCQCGHAVIGAGGQIDETGADRPDEGDR